jgi:cobalt transporter subunit CbtB
MSPNSPSAIVPGALAAPRGSATVPALLAAMFGIALLFGVGFSHAEVLHNAAHDTRHAAAFPCH